MFDNNNKIPKGQDFYSIRSLLADAKTHICLLTRLSDSIKKNLRNLVDGRIQQGGIVNGVGSFFKAITRNPDATDFEYFTDNINNLQSKQLPIENLPKNQMI